MPPAHRAEHPPPRPRRNDTSLHVCLRISRAAVSSQTCQGHRRVAGTIPYGLRFQGLGQGKKELGRGGFTERRVAGEDPAGRSLTRSLRGVGLRSCHCLWHFGARAGEMCGSRVRDHPTLTLPGNVHSHTRDMGRRSGGAKEESHLCSSPLGQCGRVVKS